MPKVIFLFCFFITSFSFSFPELVRHGYSNCINCHFSSTGGGLTNDYGRGISEEVLSTWSKKEEGLFAYGLVKPPKGLSFGGRYRALQLHMNNAFMRSGRFISMQAEIQGAAVYKNWTFVASAGLSDAPGTGESLGDQFLLREHYGQYQSTDEFRLRAGKFLPAFGLRLPDHYVHIKKGLGWEQGRYSHELESHQVEASWIAETHDVFVTAHLGRLDRPSWDLEKGVSSRASIFLGDSYKVGYSHYFGVQDASGVYSSAMRQVFGPYGIFGFTKWLYLLAEWDLLRQSPSGGASFWGMANYFRLGIEPLQGVHAYGVYEAHRGDLTQTSTFTDTMGVGFQFFPRPHLEIRGEWDFVQQNRGVKERSDYAWLLFHFYL